mgnify:CR=1 FL=1
MLLTRKSSTSSTSSQPAQSVFVDRLQRGLSQALPTLDRRGFLRRSGLRVGVGLAATQLSLVKKADAASAGAGDGSGKIEVKRTVCTHCSVGCAVDAVVENGVWVRQEPVFDSPINLGAHCAKGAALREHGHGEFRLRYPMKLVKGKYERISWDTALNEISAKLLELRKTSGPDSAGSWSVWANAAAATATGHGRIVRQYGRGGNGLRSGLVHRQTRGWSPVWR